MDDIDRKILAELQRDGRLSLTDLGERIGLSLSPCHRRVRALEEAGVIADYRANLNPSAVGLNFPPSCS
ncbi:Lrp/AsnC family transcriptional regulator [Achromobacter xylosoxidans]